MRASAGLLLHCRPVFIDHGNRFINTAAFIASYYSIVTVNSSRAVIRGATAQAACSGAKPEATGIAKTRHVGMTIDLPQEDEEDEEQRPGVTVKGRTYRGACY